MNENMFAQYLKEQLLEGKQTLTCVSDPPKKLATRGKTKPLGFQKVGHKSGHLKVTWLKHLIMSSGMGECQFQHVLLHSEEYGDHPFKNE
jgi:hypothetical protein